MEHEISFAPCYDLYHEVGATPGFSFVDTAKFRAEDCTDGSWRALHFESHAINLGMP
jgi:hypothetical protein